MRPTLPWLGRRLLLAVLVVFGAVTLTFGAMNLMPGDPARTMIGGNAPSPEVLAQVRTEMGLDHPFAERYVLFLARLARGDLGTSYQLREPVWTVIGGQLLPTVELALVAVVLALVIASLLAVTTAGRRPLARGAASTMELVMISAPGFWTGTLLLTVFSFNLRIFPAFGGSGIRGLVLPAITLALSLTGVFAQVLRSGLETALDEPFTLLARARGGGETQVRLRHAFRHALVPLITLSGWTLGALLGGAVIAETVFARPGLGRTMATAVEGRDIPTVTGIVILAAIVFSLINIVVDWLYGVVDPRTAEEYP